jgi:hypothetical protein
MLPAESRLVTSATKQNAHLFIINNCIVLPPSVTKIESEAFRNTADVFYTFGPNITEIDHLAFSKLCRLRKAVFPKLLKVGTGAF